MPKTKRDYLKRQLAQAYHHLDVSLERLLPLKTLFEPVHPEHAEGLQIALETILQAQQIIIAFAEITWGMNEESIRAYRTGKENR